MVKTQKQQKIDETKINLDLLRGSQRKLEHSAEYEESFKRLIAREEKLLKRLMRANT